MAVLVLPQLCSLSSYWPSAAVCHCKERFSATPLCRMQILRLNPANISVLNALYGNVTGLNGTGVNIYNTTESTYHLALLAQVRCPWCCIATRIRSAKAI